MTPNYSTDWSPNFIYLSANGTVWVDPEPVEGMRYLSLLNPMHGRCYFARRDGESLEAKFGPEFNIVDRRQKFLVADSAEPILTSQAMRDAAEAIKQLNAIKDFDNEPLKLALYFLAAAAQDNAEQILRMQIRGR